MGGWVLKTWIWHLSEVRFEPSFSNTSIGEMQSSNSSLYRLRFSFFFVNEFIFCFVLNCVYISLTAVRESQLSSAAPSLWGIESGTRLSIWGLVTSWRIFRICFYCLTLPNCCPFPKCRSLQKWKKSNQKAQCGSSNLFSPLVDVELMS